MLEKVIAWAGLIFVLAVIPLSCWFGKREHDRVIAHGKIIRGYIIEYESPTFRRFWDDCRRAYVRIKVGTTEKEMWASSSISHYLYPAKTDTDWVYSEKYPKMLIHLSHVNPKPTPRWILVFCCIAYCYIVFRLAYPVWRIYFG